ncbi:hypothetical protein HN592_02585 [Candidatus Woesearchaeota archaeon]|jgi:anaerobic ribonucleoside-triphosphate reductase|nr:hypothetical protein [Candidatus Woesearchaeota archaeon]MBT7928711.1 hypothetical protein [Candidatus Peregrinibacteria bacterium]MBT4368098.1 hypothetical protein [Candidatus Woesearchaeota archaeon]MBT4712586.1 hypothetical protein [Candidatus Woesearchaeota archaeon]MBT6639499.1 hypothetical protein [Candidatus Woesearchaeota archaeon]
MAPAPLTVVKRKKPWETETREEGYDSERIIVAMQCSFHEKGKQVSEDQLRTMLPAIETRLKPTRAGKVHRAAIDRAVVAVLNESMHEEVAAEYKNYAETRLKELRRIKIKPDAKGSNATDAMLLIESASSGTASPFDKHAISKYLRRSGAEMPEHLIKSVASAVETDVREWINDVKEDGEVLELTTSEIHALATAELIKHGVNPQELFASRNFVVSRENIDMLMGSKSNENGNVNSNNPEAVNLEIAEWVLKRWALSSIFEKDVRTAHDAGAMHVHDLGYPHRVYCSGHSLEYIKKYGLRDLQNLSTRSSPPKHAITLVGHTSTFLASMQAYYAGALGMAYVNLAFAPFLEGMSRTNVGRVKEEVLAALVGDQSLHGRLSSYLGAAEDWKRVSGELANRSVSDSDLETIVGSVSTKLEGKPELEQFMTLVNDYRDMRRQAKELNAMLTDPTLVGSLMEDILERFEGNDVLSDEFQRLMVQYTDMKQIAQNFVFTLSQCAFSRGSQTIFTDANLHTGVPTALKDIPIVVPGGRYRLIDKETGETEDLRARKEPTSKDGFIYTDSEGNVFLDGEGNFNYKLAKEQGRRFVTYGDYEETSQEFLEALLDVYMEGDEIGMMFPFPKCDVHVDANTFKHERQRQLLRKTCEVAAKNSSAYFIFDRDAVTLAACCRLKTAVDPKALEHPESLRFCGFQNVTINVPQASYRAAEAGNLNLDGIIDEVLETMETALQAHIQKRVKTEELMQPGGPLHQIGKPSMDGNPYVDLDKATYIVGMIGVNDAVKLLTDSELHENEESMQAGLEIIAAMYQKAKEMSERTGWKISLEESPAESAARNLALRDLRHPVYGKYAKQVIQGTEEDPYYTNSVHLRADAKDVGPIERIQKQSMFHPVIESGAIIHLFTGEADIDPDALYDLVQNIYENTQCAQITVSGTHSFCPGCGTQTRGEAFECPRCGTETDVMQKVVGYNSKMVNWNGSKRRESEARGRGSYAADASECIAKGDDLAEALIPGQPAVKAVVYGIKHHHHCDWCEDLNDAVTKLVGNNYKGKVDVEFVDVTAPGVEGRQNLARAMRAGINMGTTPGVGFEYNTEGIPRPVDTVRPLETESLVRQNRETGHLDVKYKFLDKAGAPKVRKALDAVLAEAERYLTT